MNLNHGKMLALSAVAALGLASQASAQTTNFYITGSTAFRSTAWKAIWQSPNWTGVPTFAGRNGSHAAGDNCQWMQWHGTYRGIDTFINAEWSGSEAGIRSIAVPSAANNPFFLTNGVSGTNSSLPIAGETNNQQVADISMADTSQGVSLNKTPACIGMGSLGPITDTGRVGVVTFTWAKNVNSNPSNFWSRVTNISEAQARQLLAGPIVPALITGNSTDTNNFAYAVGRNSFSGTHVNCALACQTGLGFDFQQFSIGGFPTVTSGTILAGDPSALDSTSLTVDGYDSGGDVAKALALDGSCQAADPNFGGTGWMAIGYLGMSDAASVTNSSHNFNVWLTYNGVAETDLSVEQGQYNFWGYEHCYGRPVPTVIGTGAGIFGNDLANSFGTLLTGGTPTANSAGIALSFMQASKSSDAADPAHF